MRALIASVMLAGCVTTAQPSPADRVAGCWINRDGEITTTMRWLPDPAAPGQLIGARLRYSGNAQPASMQYRLESDGAFWRFCQWNGVCWLVASAGAGPLEGGRAFIDQHGERLRISVATPIDERVIFDGQRDGCD